MNNIFENLKKRKRTSKECKAISNVSKGKNPQKDLHGPIIRR